MHLFFAYNFFPFTGNDILLCYMFSYVIISKMELYDWQKECLNTWRENRDHGIINVITGAGKTVLALAAMQDLFQRFPNTQIIPSFTRSP